MEMTLHRWFVVFVILFMLTEAESHVNNASDAESSLHWLLSLYNPHTLGNFSVDGKTISRSCAADMNEYLKALNEEQLWAAKLMDASGRYTPHFFYGNSFWIGSMSLCRELSDSHLDMKTPPFPVSFSVARLLIKMQNFSPPEGRLIFLGVCFPASCTEKDTSYILNNSYNSSLSSGKASVAVLKVRPIVRDHVLFARKTFFALGGSVLVVIFLIVIGTLYDCISKQKKVHRISTRRNEEQKDGTCDIENNNGNRKNFLECKSKVNVYEISKKEDNEKSEKDQSERGNGSMDEAKEPEEKFKGFFTEFFLSFSALSNSRKILNCSNGSEDSLDSIHGLRFLSLTWVILAHTYLQIFAVGGNKALRAETEKKFAYQIVGNATYSVDSFFLISGLLMSYLYYKNDSRRQMKHFEGFAATAGKFLTLLMYRFIRLTPVYATVLTVVHLTMTVLKDISVFETPLTIDVNCEKFWWRNILYVNNLFPRKEMCMLWSWYMAADTQFFVLSSLLLLLSKRYFKFSAIAMLTILIASWCTTAFISYINHYEVRVQEPFAFFDELYDKPWTRIGPYVVGIITGWYIQQHNGKIKVPVIVAILGWTSSLACLLSLVFGIHWGLNVAVSSVYASLGHTAWGLSLAWIVVACSSGYGGWINSVLSCPAFYPLSRLTYCAYLVHPVIMFLTVYVMDGPFHMHNGIVIIIFLGNLVSSFLLSFLLSLVFEAPFVRILKLMLSPGIRK